MIILPQMRGVVGGFTPLVYAPTLWLDASKTSTLWQDTAGTTPVTAAGNPVARIDDQSGGGRNMTQSTSSKRPVWGNVTRNGRGGLSFDGVDDNLLGSDTGLPSGTSDRTAFAVHAYPSLTNNWGGFSYGTTGVANQMFGIVKSDNGAPSQKAAVQGWSTDYKTTYTVTAGVVYQHTARLASGTLTQNIAKVQVFSGASSLNTVLSSTRLDRSMVGGGLERCHLPRMIMLCIQQSCCGAT